MTNVQTRTFAGLPFPEKVDEWLSAPSDEVTRRLQRHTGPFLVLGAGGKMGLHLCLMLRRALAALGRDDRVIAVSRFRTLRDGSDFTDRGIETISGDLTDAAFVAALPEAPCVFFLAGVKFGTASDPALLRKMNVEMPRQVAQRFKNSRIVAFSSGCVYPFVTPASGGATEDTPVAPTGDYARSCVAREEAFQAITRDHGTRVALVRLNYSVEVRYGLLVDIALAVKNRQPVNVEMGYANVIWQRDAVAHVIQSLDLAGAPAVFVNVTGEEILSVRSIAEAFGRRFGMDVEITGTEAATAWLNNARHTHEQLGRPAVTSAQMIEWIAAWLEADGENWGKPTGFERRDGKF